MDKAIVEPRRGNRVRLLAISDWRVQDYEDLLQLVERVPGCDVVLYGGDDLDRVIEAQDVIRQIVEMTSARRLLFVAGNDDVPEDKQSLGRIEYSHDLHEEPFFYKGFAFLGVEGTTDGMGFIQHSEAQVRETLDQHMLSAGRRKGSKAPLPVVVSHAPPRGVLDIAMRHASQNGARSIGSTSLRQFLEENRVPLTVCGHVHLCGGRQETLPNRNLVVNIASHDHRGAEGRIAVIDLTRSGQAEVSFHSTSVLLYDHELSRLQHVGIKRVRQLLQNGIRGLEDVTAENKRKLRLRGCGERHIARWIRQSELIRGGFVGIEIFDRAKMGFLTEGRFVVWDIETDLDQSRIWLIGAHDTQTGETRQFFNPDDEKSCVREFIDWMTDRREAIPVSFSSTRFDARVLSKSLARHDIQDTTDVTGRDVDLGNILLYSCVHTYPSTKVKDLAHHLGYKFRHPDLDGMSVGIMFSQYLRTGRPPKKWKPYLEYNEDDVAATLLILNRLRQVDGCSSAEPLPHSFKVRFSNPKTFGARVRS